MIHFNPRTTRGATGIQQRHLPPHQISIHAPHGARPDIDLDKRLIHVFQSMHHTGCDATFGIPASASANFNPRTTRGATVYNIDISGSIIDFNPRATRGATYERGKMQIMEYISIHAPHGARPLITLYCNHTTMYFNPRATRGATPLLRRRL